MNGFIKKVIRASAGTGKTYRLSLEYIGLLLRFRDQGIHFSEILVITFTRKATAEIRERIFSHLRKLIEPGEESETLRSHLRDMLDIPWRRDDAEYLRAVYEQMLTGKHQVQISTIDSYINRLFRSIIAPYIGLSSYRIDSRMEPRYFAELYSYALQPDNLPLVVELFKRSGKRTLEDYEKLIDSILKQRWLFHFIDLYARPQPMPAHEEIEKRFMDYCHIQEQIIARLAGYLREDKPDATADTAVRGEYHTLFFTDEAQQRGDWLGRIRTCLQERAFVQENFSLLLKGDPFWNRGQLLRKKIYADLKAELEQQVAEATRLLADYLDATLFRQEEEELRSMTRMLLQRYDVLRFQDQVFSHSDVAYYTFKYLYDPELSLVADEAVTNAFYEILASRVRFLLIDEFQDTSLLQMRILWPVIKEVVAGEGVRPYGGVIAVGDEKQSIYGWRGGERDLLLRLPRLLGGAESLRLERSFRSQPLLMQFVNDFFTHAELQETLKAHDMEWPYETCSTAIAENGGGLLVRLQNVNKEAEENSCRDVREAAEDVVRNEIAPLLEQGVLQAGQTALLARENRDLLFLAAALDDLRIDYVLESSRSVLHHRAVKPLLHLLRFLARNDAAELCKFLRSDYVLMNGPDLKQVLLAWRDLTADASSMPLIRRLAQRLPHLPVLAKIAALAPFMLQDDVLNFCKRIIETFAVPRLFAQENDSKNLHFFLELAAAFVHQQRDYPVSAEGFLRYCHDRQDDENWQQLGLEEIEAIRLLTIHKAKGLEFENVFLFMPLRPDRGRNRAELQRYVQFDEIFREIVEHALTFNYQRILEASSRQGLVKTEEAREVIEDLNTFYVAITRAKRRLGIYLTVDKKAGLVEAGQSKEDEEPAANKLILRTLQALLSEQNRYASETTHSARAQWGDWQSRTGAAPAATEAPAENVWHYLDTRRRSYWHPDTERMEKEKYLDYKSVYVNKRHVDRGNIVHYYLSWIRFDSDEARAFAARRTLADFGSLMRSAEIRSLLVQVDRFLDEHIEYFSAAPWGRVFTEQTFFTSEGVEQRIDRLMVDDTNQRILIIDFKTGESYEPGQLQGYIETIANLAWVRQHGYSVNGKFLEIHFEDHRTSGPEPRPEALS